jgi:hypothetical protein
VRIPGIYSNMLENPSVISSTKNPKTNKVNFPDISGVQLTYLPCRRSASILHCARPSPCRDLRSDPVTLDNYDFKSFGYLRVVDTRQLRIEFHPEGDGVTTKTPDDFVTVSLADGTLVHYTAPSIPLNNQV